MPEKISSSKQFVGAEYDTYIPTVSEAASIQDALKLFYFGRSDDGTTFDATDSLYAHLVELKDLIDPILASLSSHTGATSGVHGLDSGVAFVGTTQSQTLTNKTLESPLINTPKINGIVSLNATSTELNAMVGISSNVQTQLNNKLGSTETAVNSNKVGNRTIFVQSSQPTANAVGDIWFQVTGL